MGHLKVVQNTQHHYTSLQQNCQWHSKVTLHLSAGPLIILLLK